MAFGANGCAAGESARGNALSAEEGDKLYQQNCSICHGQDGRGLPPTYPPLAGHLPRLFERPGGRAYVVRVPLFGLAGPLAIEGERYDGLMAPFAFRSDRELAAILNHALTAWGNDRLLQKGSEPVAAEEIGAARGERLDGAGVGGLRPRLTVGGVGKSDPERFRRARSESRELFEGSVERDSCAAALFVSEERCF